MKITEKKNAKVTIDFDEMDTLLHALTILRSIDFAMDDNDANYLDIGEWGCEQSTLQDAIELLDHIGDLVNGDTIEGYTIEMVEEL